MAMYSLRDGESSNGANFKLCANWAINKVAAKLNEEKQRDEDFPPWKFGVSSETSGHILRRVREGSINNRVADDLFSEFWNEARQAGYKTHGGFPERVDEIIESRGLKQISDSGAIEKIVGEVLAKNAKQVSDYRAGKEKAFNSLVGQVMKATQGKANPAQVNEILKRKLTG
jgi:aspartyl-tRNA(Asn)/glutamyl-tRNA(Gln) amidotransferase subunit B